MADNKDMANTDSTVPVAVQDMTDHELSEDIAYVRNYIRTCKPKDRVFAQAQLATLAREMVIRSLA